MVFIKDKHHLCDPSEVSLYPGSKELVEAASEKNWHIVVITSQSGIARGYFGRSDYERVTDRLLTMFEASPSLAGIYANEQGAEAPAGSWRKPSPNMKLMTSRELNLDQKSPLGGDHLSDLEGGSCSGVKRLSHVLTGHVQREMALIKAWARQDHEGCGESPKSESATWIH